MKKEKKETLFYTPMTPLEKKYIRRTALWMFGLMAAGCLALVHMTPLWYGDLPTDAAGMLAVGCAIMASALPLHLLAGSRKLKPHGERYLLYIPAVLLNLLGMSLFEAAYYTRIEVEPPMVDLIAGAAIPIGFALVCLLLIGLLPHAMAVLPFILGGVNVAGMVTCIVFWVKAGHRAGAVLWSFGFFNLTAALMVMIAFVFAAGEVSRICGEEAEESVESVESAEDASDTQETSAEEPAISEPQNIQETPADPESEAAWGWMRFLSFASFGLFLIVAAVVLLILMCLAGSCGCDDCDCDCCDGSDCGVCGGSTASDKKSVKRKTRRRGLHK